MRRITAALLATMMLLLSACGGDEPEASPTESEATTSAKDIIVQAAAATQDAGSAKIAMTMKLIGGAQDLTITADGALDFATQRSVLKMQLPQSVPGTGGEGTEIRTDGNIVYMKLPNGAQLGLPTPWLKMDVAEMAKNGGMPGMNQPGNDPAQNMQLLRGATGDAREVGPEEVRGTPATHYRATIDLAQVIKSSPKAQRKAVAAQFKTLGLKTVPIDVWIDDNGVLLREDVLMDLRKADTAKTPGAPTGMKLSLEFFDFGTKVDVKPPPKNQVTDFAEIQPGG